MVEAASNALGTANAPPVTPAKKTHASERAAPLQNATGIAIAARVLNANQAPASQLVQRTRMKLPERIFEENVVKCNSSIKSYNWREPLLRLGDAFED